MARIGQAPAGVSFVGSVGSDRDVEVAAVIAAACAAYRADDDDEDPLGGAATCFGCRYRRWTADGFTCMKGLLPAELSPTP